MPGVYRIKVAAVRGTCNAGFAVGDAFQLDGLHITPLGNDKACCAAFASLVASLGRVKLAQRPLYISCPDPATGVGGNVLFEIMVVPDEDSARQAGADHRLLPCRPHAG